MTAQSRPAESKIEPEFADQKRSEIRGWRTQFDNLPEDAKPVQVIIGLDFGTAFTKVVLQGAGHKFGVPLNDNTHGADRFLLPTRLYEDSTGNLSVAEPKDCQKTHDDLKMKILDGDLDDDARNHIVVYIAHVLRKARGWLMTEQKDVYGESILKWVVNIGLPTEKYEDDRLQKVYREFVEKAWYESTNPSKNEGSEKAKQLDRELHSDYIETFPEFAAQIQGYISSPQRRGGVHVLADIGAATVDVTVFIVYQHDGEDREPILASSVRKLGDIYRDHHLRSTENDQEFKRKILEQINHCLGEAHQKAPLQEEWEGGFPLMLCGGGARVEFYQRTYSEDVINAQKRTTYGRALQYVAPGSLRLDKLTAHGLPGEDEDRLSVAYGLSLGQMNPDGTPVVPDDFSDSSVTRSPKLTCPKCNGVGSLHATCSKCGGSGFV